MGFNSAFKGLIEMVGNGEDVQWLKK